jgi:zinc transporter ZupT
MLLALTPHDLTNLPSSIQVLAGAFGVAGAVVGFFFQASSGRQLIENIVLGGAAGGLLGTALALALFIVASATGA